ncbi:MAG TPA: FkbM family methyltransferase [Polyangia bacterium]
MQKLARSLYEGIAARRYPPGSLSTAVQNGRTWKLRRDVAERGEDQDLATILWFRGVTRPGMSVIDVGANVGQMTLELGVLVGAAGRVVAIEPSQGNLEYLRQHVVANGLDQRVTVVDGACADQDGGTVTFFMASPDGVSSVGSGHNIIGADPILKQTATLQVSEQHVPRVSIDGLCRRLALEPAVIKIDVEGAELLVLKGAKETLRRARPQVRMSFHPFAFLDPRAATVEITALMEEVGYRIEGRQSEAGFGLSDYNLIPL